MAFSEIELKRIEQAVGELCRKHSPGHLKDKLRLDYSVKGHEVVIFERRPKWDNAKEWIESPVAKLKFIRSADKWRLYWQPSDLKWHEYPGPSSSDRLGDLVQEIDADPLACFFDKNADSTGGINLSHAQSNFSLLTILAQREGAQAQLSRTLGRS